MVPENACNAALFRGEFAAPTGARPAGAGKKKRAAAAPARFEAWPLEDDRVARLMQQRGAASIEAMGSRNVVAAGNSGGRVLVAGCVRGRWTSVKASTRRSLARALLKTHCDVFGRTGSDLQTYVLAPFGKSWRLHKLSSP